MILKRIDLIILKSLFSSPTGLEAFTLYRRVRVFFPDFTSAINRLDDLKLINIDGQKIKIERKGIEIISNSYSGSDMRMRPKWREVPERFIGKKIEINDFYIPSRSRLDKSFTNQDT